MRLCLPQGKLFLLGRELFECGDVEGGVRVIEHATRGRYAPVLIEGVEEIHMQTLPHSLLTSMTTPCGVSRQHPGNGWKVVTSQELLDKSRAGCNQPEDDSRKVSCSQRQVTLLFAQSINDPQRAVHCCYGWLDEVSLVTVQVADNLWNVRHVHHH